MEDACRREFLEETGYHVKMEKLVDARIENHSGETALMFCPFRSLPMYMKRRTDNFK